MRGGATAFERQADRIAGQLTDPTLPPQPVPMGYENGLVTSPNRTLRQPATYNCTSPCAPTGADDGDDSHPP